jgi:ClpP class serine protease
MAKKLAEAVDELLDALVWMRRKAKKHEPVDEVIDALMKMRRRAKKKLAKNHPKKSQAAVNRKRLSSQGRK